MNSTNVALKNKTNCFRVHFELTYIQFELVFQSQDT